MLARITFSETSVSKEKLDELSKIVGESIDSEQRVQVFEDGEWSKPQQFYSWSATLDEAIANDPEKDKKLARYCDSYLIKSGNEYIADPQVLMTVYPEIKFSMRGLPMTSEKAIDMRVAAFTDIADKLKSQFDEMQSVMRKFDKSVEFNQKCEVHVPNFGMLNINQVGFKTDVCTQDLQGLMNQGWRILAVCPQPDQRRPDYIMGRYNPENDIDLGCYEL